MSFRFPATYFSRSVVSHSRVSHPLVGLRVTRIYYILDEEILQETWCRHRPRNLEMQPKTKTTYTTNAAISYTNSNAVMTVP